MSTIQVKPAPGLPAGAAKAIVHPASGSLLDAAGNVPANGRPWLYDGFTCRMLTEGAILRADDPVFAESVEPEAPAPAVQPADTPAPAGEPDPAH